jgi:hypothetical protein
MDIVLHIIYIVANKIVSVEVETIRHHYTMYRQLILQFIW